MGSRTAWVGLGSVVCALATACAGSVPRPRLSEKLYVLDAEGKHLYVADPATRRVAWRVRVGKRPHGIAAPNDAHVLFVSLEGKDRLLWIDPATDDIVHSLEVGDHPNEIECTPDGRFVYVASERDGTYYVVDAQSVAIVSRIHTGGAPHNVVRTPDGAWMLLAPLGEPRRVTIVDARTHEVAGEIPFSDVVRPIAVSADGSRLYANVNGLAGFEVADLAQRSRIARIELQMPDTLATRTPTVTKSTSHGLAVRPGGRELWTVDDRGGVYVFDLAIDPPSQVAVIALDDAGDARAYWVSFSTDGRLAYVSQPWRHQVSVVDADTRTVIAVLPAGKAPKRTLELRFPSPAQDAGARTPQ